MTTTDEWVRERARALHLILQGRYDAPGTAVEQIEAAIQLAIERGKAEQDKAVAAERERWERDTQHARAQQVDADIRAARAEAKLARLENPDEALVKLVVSYFGGTGLASHFLGALARILTETSNAKD